MDWQPIETAPKDRMVLLFCPDDDNPPVPGDPDQLGNWEVTAGFWDCGWRSGFVHVALIEPAEVYPEPTHWMPLPTPPQSYLDSGTSHEDGRA